MAEKSHRGPRGSVAITTPFYGIVRTRRMATSRSAHLGRRPERVSAAQGQSRRWLPDYWKHRGPKRSSSRPGNALPESELHVRRRRSKLIRAYGASARSGTRISRRASRSRSPASSTSLIRQHQDVSHRQTRRTRTAAQPHSKPSGTARKPEAKRSSAILPIFAASTRQPAEDSRSQLAGQRSAVVACGPGSSGCCSVTVCLERR